MYVKLTSSCMNTLNALSVSSDRTVIRLSQNPRNASETLLQGRYSASQIDGVDCVLTLSEIPRILSPCFEIVPTRYYHVPRPD